MTTKRVDKAAMRKLEEKPCEYCHKVFKPCKRTIRFCSVACRNRSRRKPDIKCPTCEQMFFPKNGPHQVYCSVDCTPQRSKKRTVYKKTCLNCKKDFKHSVYLRKYCSNRCSVQHRPRAWSSKEVAFFEEKVNRIEDQELLDMINLKFRKDKQQRTLKALKSLKSRLGYSIKTTEGTFTLSAISAITGIPIRRVRTYFSYSRNINEHHCIRVSGTSTILVPMDELENVKAKINPDLNDYVSIQEVAKDLGYANKSLQAVVKRNNIHHKRHNGQIYVRKELLEAAKKQLLETGALRVDWVSIKDY